MTGAGVTAASPTAGRGLPDEFAAWDSAGRATLEVAARADEWDATTRAAALAWLTKHRDLVTLVEGRVLTAEREAGTWSLRGDRDLASFAGRVSHEGRGAGYSAVGGAVTLEAMPRLAEAMADGPVTSTHLREVTRAAGASPALAAFLASDEGQEKAVELARRLDGSAFGKELRRTASRLDPATRQREHDEQRARRHLTLSHTAGGTRLTGELDNVTGYKLARALDAFDPRPGADDDRDAGQRRADALGAIADAALADRSVASGPIAPVQGIVTFREETWVALRGQGRAGSAGDGSAAGGLVVGGSVVDGSAVDGSAVGGSAVGVMVALRDVPPVVDETGMAWPASEVARALCGCTLTRAVLDAAGRVLDLGRDVRLFDRRHWLALEAEGVESCAVDGCTMPLRRTELHHMTWWYEEFGPTDQSNCAPECSFHHHEVHRLGLRVTRREDGSYEHRHPDGRTYGGSPAWPKAPPAIAPACPPLVAPGCPPGEPPDEPPDSLLDLLAG